MIRVLILTALPQEHSHFRRLTSPWAPMESMTIRGYWKHLPEREIHLVETGMGRGAIERALDGAFQSVNADLILSTGFAGSLDPGIGVGRVCLGERFLAFAGGALSNPETTVLSCPAGPTLARFASRWELERVRVSTVETVMDKQALCDRFGGLSTLVDMETYFTALEAAKRDLPLLSIRSVSDGRSDAIDFDVASLTDGSGCVRISRVIHALVRSPRLLPSLLAAWSRSRLAAASLAEVLRAFLELPSGDLDRILKEQRVPIRDSSED